MSIKSKTHKGTGFNELRFEDEKGSEEVFIHAEKDYRRLIKNNEIVKIEGELKVNVIGASEKKAKAIQVTANDFMEFNLGANQIKMTPTQITVAGKKVSIKGQAMTSIQGGMVKINAGGGGASQAKASLEKMAVEAKVGEFDGFKGNETAKSEGSFDSKDAGSLALDAMPVIGVLKGIAQVIMGKDLVTGDTIHRGAEALATVAGIVPGGKVAAKGAMKIAGKTKVVATEFTGKYKGKPVTLKNIEVQEINYTRRSRESLDKLRKKFDSSVRKNYLKSIGSDPEKIKIMKDAGFTNAQISKVAQGGVPKGYNVHHKIPINDGGTNDYSNLVLIRNNSEHYTITNAQRDLTSRVPYGETVKINFPVPPSFLYPLKGN